MIWSWENCQGLLQSWCYNQLCILFIHLGMYDFGPAKESCRYSLDGLTFLGKFWWIFFLMFHLLFHFFLGSRFSFFWHHIRWDKILILTILELSNFVSPSLELHNQYYHNLRLNYFRLSFSTFEKILLSLIV